MMEYDKEYFKEKAQEYGLNSDIGYYAWVVHEAVGQGEDLLVDLLDYSEKLTNKAQKEVLDDLNTWRDDISSRGCLLGEEVEIMSWELKDWIDLKRSHSVNYTNGEDKE